MKTSKLLSAAIVVAVLASSATAFAQVAATKAGAQTVKLNDKIRKNVFEWLSAAPMETIKGSAPGVTGTINVDPADLNKTTGSLSVPVSGMKTGNPIRDGHLQSADWLDAKKFPNITYKIDKVSGCRAKDAKATCKVMGGLTIHGVTKRVGTDAEITWKKGNAKTARKAPGDWVKIKLDFTIALADYKVAGKQGVVGNKVGKTIKVFATLYGNVQ